MSKSVVFLCISLLSACQTTPLTSVDPIKPLEKPTEASSKPSFQKSMSKSPASSNKDGAPSGPLPTVFKEAFPVNEPLSHYGNPGSYQVKGKKYSVLTSSAGYHKQGTASWYGTKFHKERTSSGEPYDMYALTAAHKTLPLPTYVRVKNLENGREAVIKVNDRGPFHEDRLIDLSYAAAVKLGLLPKGTASVDIEALSSAPKAEYYLQVGAFQSFAKADALREKLTTLNVDSNIQIEKRDARHVIYLGPFSDKKQSEALKKILNQHGFLGSFSYLQ